MARPPIRRLALALASLTATLALLEGAATLHLGGRFVRGAELGNTWSFAGHFDPELGWSGRPHAHGRVFHGGLDYRVRLNARGFRDPERALAKPAGVRRVVALGDSVAWGWGVEQGERFTDLLEARLGPGVEVLDLACPGYGTDQQYWTLMERGLAYEPDVVLLCVVLNDVLEAQRATSYAMSKPRFVRDADGTWRVEGRPVPEEQRPSRAPGAWRWLVRRSALLTFATRGAPEPAPQADPEGATYRRPSPEALAQVRAAADQLLDPDGAARHALTLLRDACAERGIGLLVTCVPHRHDRYLYEPRFPLPEELEEGGERGPEPFHTHFTRRLGELCDELGLPLVPVDQAFLETCRAGTRLHAGDGHPNAAGHRVIADRLEPALRSLLGH